MTTWAALNDLLDQQSIVPIVSLIALINLSFVLIHAVELT